jgi:hypothetical protein
MSEERIPTDEYDQKHGTPKGYEPTETDTGPASAPEHSRPSPIKPKSGGGVD